MTENPKKTIKAHCPNCDGERTCEVHGTVEKTWDWEEQQNGYTINGAVEHSLLECRGCETVFYERQSWNSEDIEQYFDVMGEPHYEPAREIATFPIPDRKTKPVWFDAMQNSDAQLHNILKQMYFANDNEAYILTAIGLRTALDRATEVLKIDPAITFDEKLDALRDGGWIGQTERDVLGVVTDAGNAAAHRGWEPAAQEANELISAMEAFLHRAFIVGQKALSIKGNIPAKPKRQPKPKPAAVKKAAVPKSSP